MKKLLFLVPIFCLFILASCDNDPYIYESTSNTIETTTVNNPTTQTNIPEQTTNEESTTSESSPIPDYEDDTEWKGTIF